MPDFPQLKTGAVAQFPAERNLGYETRVTRFVNGEEQRYREISEPAHRWVIRLDLLSEAEAAALEQFFLSVQGASGEFNFTDPWSGIQHTDCSLENDHVRFDVRGADRVRTALVIRKNRS
ncbi:MAG: DUF2460 domain-containing protein [Bryobacteraceae bacterium]